LGKLRAQEAVDLLVVIANDPQSYGPGEAIDALARIGGRRAVAALEAIFRTGPDLVLRQRAWIALHSHP